MTDWMSIWTESDCRHFYVNLNHDHAIKARDCDSSNLLSLVICEQFLSSLYKTRQCADQEWLHLCIQKTLPKHTGLCFFYNFLEYKRGETIWSKSKTGSNCHFEASTIATSYKSCSRCTFLLALLYWMIRVSKFNRCNILLALPRHRAQRCSKIVIIIFTRTIQHNAAV